MKKVIITGGAGYVGTRLTKQLLDKGYTVVVYDTMYFGCYLDKHPRLSIVDGDIRDAQKFHETCIGGDVVINLACISNDPSFELDDALSTTINYECFEPLVVAAKKAKIKRFINASTSSVYGVSSAKNVTEDHPLVPLTHYNKFKGLCEKHLFKHQSPEFVCVTIRPATICGYSPRMRFDLSVNILTNHAISNGKITVFGGAQLRPNLHIQDMCDLYEFLLEVPDEKIAGETFNFGFQNLSLNDLANIVKKIVEKEFPEKGDIEITKTASNDMRSYHICSDKIATKLGYKPKKTVEDAVRELCVAFKKGLFKDTMSNDAYYNVKTLKAKGIK